MKTPVLDTHAWVAWMIGTPDLPSSTCEALDALAPDQRPFLSAISLWEVAMLVELERLSLELPLGDWLDKAAHPRTVQLVPITPQLPPVRPPSRQRFIATPPIGSLSRRASNSTRRS